MYSSKRLSPLLPLAAIALSLPGCSQPYQVVEVPRYGADLYPSSQSKAGVTIAVDEIRTAQRAERYFGSNLISQGILPVNVVISNYSSQRVTMKSSDIILHQWKEVLDPMPLELVVAAAKREHGRVNSAAERQVDNFFQRSAFRDPVLLPNDTYNGVVYFALPEKKQPGTAWFRSFSAYPSGQVNVRVGVTNLDTGERLVFGPLMVGLPEQ